MREYIRANPAAVQAWVTALVAALLNVGLVFGLHLSADQIAAINALVLCTLTLVLGLWTQTKLQMLLDKRVDQAVRNLMAVVDDTTK